MKTHCRRPRVHFHPRRGPSTGWARRCRTRTGAAQGLARQSIPGPSRTAHLTPCACWWPRRPDRSVWLDPIQAPAPFCTISILAEHLIGVLPAICVARSKRSLTDKSKEEKTEGPLRGSNNHGAATLQARDFAVVNNGCKSSAIFKALGVTPFSICVFRFAGNAASRSPVKIAIQCRIGSD